MDRPGGHTDPHVLDTAGAGPPVVILYGLAGSARELWPTARAPAHLIRVLLVDQRGHGRGTARPEDTSRQAFVADAVAVIEEWLTRALRGPEQQHPPMRSPEGVSGALPSPRGAEP